jgi:hypothetical protein
MALKPQPWYTQFNQTPRSPAHGRNWKPTPAPHRHPIDGASSRVDPGSQDTIAISWAIGTTFIYPIPKPPASAIPYAGVTAGEIIGHRIWYVLGDGSLCSLAHYFIWKPGAVIEGNLNEVIHRNFWFGKTTYGGVYSYANQDHIDRETDKFCYKWPTLVQFDLGQPCLTIFGIAIGTIKCWGEVIEHEKGYRAQYAKLTSIDYVIGAVDINELRQRYLP